MTDLLLSAAPARVSMFGITLDAVRLDDAVARIYSWRDEPSGGCRYVVTPNVDHVVLLQSNDSLRAAYWDADLVVADGWPLVTASRWLGRPLPERVAGSDLVPALFAAAEARGGLRVYLLGAAPGVAERARERCERTWPAVEIVGTYSPPLGFERDAAENESIVERVNAAAPDVLILGLGAPKQELWIHRHAPRLTARAALCVGATIDFLAGERRRAPRWVQRLGLEWCHRLLSDPRRLARRYARDAWVFPPLVWRELRS